MTQMMNRRRFLATTGLLGAGLAAGGLAAPRIARADATTLVIVSNPGLENATLNALMHQQGYFEKFGVKARIVEARGAAGPFNAIVKGKGDVCMVSGYNMVLSRIEKGAKAKIVGAAMRKTALTVYTRSAEIRTLADLQGRTVAVGPGSGLLHMLMLQLLKTKGIEASRVNFVNKGSNNNCYSAVVKGEADACCSSISHLDDADGLSTLAAGNMWQALPDYLFQTAYASDAALAQKHDALVPVMAAYGALYAYMMTSEAKDAFFAARKHAEKHFDAPSAKAVWTFLQAEHPYDRDLTVTPQQIGYQQDMFLALGSLKKKQPFAEVADMSAASAAARLLK